MMEAGRLMQALYFAYGSNLVVRRMSGRVPSARPLGVASLRGYRLTFDKRGRDGSGKANLRAEDGATVWGALYQLDASHWKFLDACERGYTRLTVQAALGRAAPAEAQTYRSDLLTDEPVLFASYKQLLVDGAREHGLPEEWIRFLLALPEKPDLQSTAS